jgi:hypothetical protein
MDSDRATVTDVVKSVRARFYRALAGSSAPMNPIGFYHRQLPAGRSLVANQLDRGDNRVARLFPDLPVGTVLTKWDVSAQSPVETTLLASGWTRPDLTLHPGEGAVLQTESPVRLTFIGEVQPAFYQPVDTQWSLISSPIPRAGPLNSALLFPKCNSGETGEILQLTGDSPDYKRSSYEAGCWQPAPEPWVEVGEAFWSYRSPNTYIWKGVCQPLGTSAALDHPEPFLTIERAPSALITLAVDGPPGAIVQLYGSSDLHHWTPLGSVTNQGQVTFWTDRQTSAHGHRFYRASWAEP